MLVLALGFGGIFLIRGLPGTGQRKVDPEKTEPEVPALSSQPIPEVKGEPIPPQGSVTGNQGDKEEPEPEPEPEPPAEPVTIAFAGDILFDPSYAIMNSINKNGGEVSSAFSSDLMERMRAADFFVINNEFPYTDRGTPLPGKAFTFRAKPESVRFLTDMGVDLAGLANNHASDFGEVSLLDTLDTLDGAGIPHIGAGHDLEEARAPYFYETGSLKIGFIAATQIERLDTPDTRGATETSPGVFRCWNPEKLYETVAEVKKECDFLVVFIHWGTESVEGIDWAQEAQGPKIAEAGADLIVGSHPHILQKFDIVSGVPVAYSLGNYLFNSKTIDTGLLEAEISPEGKLNSLRFVPVLQSGCKAKLLSGNDRERVLSHMRKISPNVRIDEEGLITW